MKKRQVIGLVVAGLLAGFVSHAVAQSATAYSSTAVGVIKKTLPARGYAFISFPLDSSKNVETIFSETPLMDLPVGSTVSLFDVTNQVWETVKKAAANRGGWGDLSNRVIQVQQPIFVFNYGSTPYNAIFAGEVPTNDSYPVAFPSKSFQTFGNPYPVQLTWGQTVIASNAAVGSSAMIWDVENQRWVNGTKASAARGGWNDFANQVILPGEGVFFKEYATSGWIWDVEKPYVWPAE